MNLSVSQIYYSYDLPYVPTRESAKNGVSPKINYMYVDDTQCFHTKPKYHHFMLEDGV